MKTSLFDYELPRHLIAQYPAESRANSRLLVLNRVDGSIEHRIFQNIIDYLHPGDLLVANNSRVIPARLHGRKITGGKVEVFLLRQLDNFGKCWECLVRGRNITEGRQILLPRKDQSGDVEARIVQVRDSGIRVIQFSVPINPLLPELGEIPLPPYITRYRGDPERYQTVYSRAEGSVAAPTAGLHFTPELLSQLDQLGIRFRTVTLHIGLDTFRPVTSEYIGDHQIHTEWATLPAETVQSINETRKLGGRIVAVGTTTVRTLEWAATSGQHVDPYDPESSHGSDLAPFSGFVDLYIRPGYRFRIVDMLITNFHLPRSSLMMLVSAFIGQAHLDDLDLGRQVLIGTYKKAVEMRYRFYSFGDAMLIL